MRTTALALFFAVASTHTAFAQIANAGFESGDYSSWSSWGALSTINGTSPITGTYDARKTLDAGEDAAGIYQDDVAITTGRARSQISFVVDTALAPGVQVRVTVEGYGTTESYFEYVIADSTTPVGEVITNFVAGDLPDGTAMTRIAAIIEDTTGTGGVGVVRFDDARLETITPGCGDRILDTGLGEACDTGEKRSDAIVGACRLDCSAFVQPPVQVEDAGVDDASVSSDGGPDGGTLTRDKGDCAIGHGPASSLPLLVLVGLVFVARARRTRRR